VLVSSAYDIHVCEDKQRAIRHSERCVALKSMYMYMCMFITVKVCITVDKRMYDNASSKERAKGI
jgi:hypothetical protein